VKLHLRAVLLGIALGCAGPTVNACGDKLVALGGGMSFQRVFSSRHPGKLILYMPADSALRAANKEMQIDASLTRAGHSVRSVSTRGELDDALRDAAADLVVTDWVDARAVNADLGGRVAVLPVLTGGEAAGSTRAGCMVDAVKYRGRLVVRAVEQVLTTHSKGLPAACAGSDAAAG